MMRDVIQAYTQSETELNRSVYVKPVPEFGLSEDMLLRIVRPLYGVPEAGLHWFKTYHGFHKRKLGLTPAPHDLCLLFTKHGMSLDKVKKPAAITCLQTDDSLCLGNSQFLALEDESTKQFECKPLKKLAVGSSLKFNGTIITKDDSSIALRAAVSGRNILVPVQEDPIDKDGYVAQRARGAYIASVCLRTWFSDLLPLHSTSTSNPNKFVH